MAIRYSIDTHNVAFPSKVRSGMCGHTLNCYITEDTDNGELVGVTNWHGYDEYNVTTAPSDFAGVIRGKAANGHWYIEVTNAGSTPTVFIHQPVIIAEDFTRSFTRESNFFNAAETVVKGYVLSVLDIIQESEVIFTGTPAENKTVTWDSSTKKFVVGN